MTTLSNGKPLRILLAREKITETRPQSIALYCDEVIGALTECGVEFEEVGYEEEATAEAFDLIWAPGLGNRRVPRSVLANPEKSVVTLHGINGLFDPIDFKGFGLRKALGHYRWRKRIQWDWSAIRGKIRHVIAVSDISARQISTNMRIDRARVSVIGHGVETGFFGANAVGRGDYILHISQFAPVKNLERLIEAYDAVRDRLGETLRIISIDAPALPTPEGCEISRDRIGRADVISALSGAHLMAMPSLEESFCLPVLEAMAAGVPALTSRGTGAEEIAAGAAILVDPLDVASIADGLLRGCCDDTLRSSLIDAGAARARVFSWPHSADAHLRLFRQLVDADETAHQ